MAHDYEDEHEKLLKTSAYLEEEVLWALKEAAGRLAKDTGRIWTKDRDIGPALSDFVTRRGMML